ncbi:MAG: SMC-Scp complex subunit ScpB [Eubacteriales bacterium]
MTEETIAMQGENGIATFDEDRKTLSSDEIKRIAEAALFAAGYPLTFEKLGEVMEISAEEVRSVIEEYKKEYDSDPMRGIQLLILGNACQLVTKEVYADYVKAALGVRDGGNLSKASLETLAIIAYNQPATRSYVEQVRGVDSSYSIGVLLEHELIEEKGRLDVPGRPRLYGTTEAFLRTFGLSSPEELPPLEDAPTEAVAGDAAADDATVGIVGEAS